LQILKIVAKIYLFLVLTYLTNYVIMLIWSRKCSARTDFQSKSGELG